MVLSTVTECFYTKKFFEPTPSPAPFLGCFSQNFFLNPPHPQPLFWGVFLRNFGAQGFSPFETFPLDFYVSGIFRIIPRTFLFGPNLIFGPRGGGHLGVIQNEFLQTWSCYISSEKHF